MDHFRPFQWICLLDIVSHQLSYPPSKPPKPATLSSSRRRQARASRANPRNDIGTTRLCRERRHDADVRGDGGRELVAELAALLEAAGDAGGAQRAQAVVGVARLGLALLALGHLGQVAAALDCVDVDEAGFEVGVRGPGAVHLGDAAAGGAVVFGVDVEVGDLLHVN